MRYFSNLFTYICILVFMTSKGKVVVTDITLAKLLLRNLTFDETDLLLSLGL